MADAANRQESEPLSAVQGTRGGGFPLANQQKRQRVTEYSPTKYESHSKQESFPSGTALLTATCSDQAESDAAQTVGTVVLHCPDPAGTFGGLGRGQEPST